MIERKHNVTTVITIATEINRAETSNALRAAGRLFDLALQKANDERQIDSIMRNRSRLHDLFLAVCRPGDREPSND